MPESPDKTGRRLVLYAAVAVGLFFFMFTNSAGTPGGFVHEAIEYIGLALIVFCVVGKNWVAFYDDRSAAFSRSGPYSVCRYPSEAFGIIGFAGIGAQLGSVSTALIAGAAAWIAAATFARREDEIRLAAFGEKYRAYRAATPTFWPTKRMADASGPRHATPPSLQATFLNSIYFFLPVPIAELFESLQQVGILPVLFVLP